MATTAILTAIEPIDRPEAGLIFGIFLAVVFLIWEFRSWYCLKSIPGPFLNALSIYPMMKNAATGKASMNLKKPMDVYDAGFWVANNFWLRVTKRGVA
jgi:hypothetical protein